MFRVALIGVLAVALAGVGTPALLAQGKTADEKAAAEKLRKAHDIAHKTESGLQLLKSERLGRLGFEEQPELAEASRALAKVRGPIKELDGMLERVNKAVNPNEAKKGTATFFDNLKLVKLDTQAEELRKIGKSIRHLPIALVSDGVDEAFKVTPELLVKQPREAEKRFGELLAAMQTNAAYLKARQAQLEEVHKHCQAAAKALTKLNVGIEKAVRAGLFTRTLVEKYLDVDNLSLAYNEVAADAASQARAAQAAAEVQLRRRDNLRSTVNTLFGFKL